MRMSAEVRRSGAPDGPRLGHEVGVADDDLWAVSNRSGTGDDREAVDESPASPVHELLAGAREPTRSSTLVDQWRGDAQCSPVLVVEHSCLREGSPYAVGHAQEDGEDGVVLAE